MNNTVLEAISIAGKAVDETNRLLSADILSPLNKVVAENIDGRSECCENLHAAVVCCKVSSPYKL